MDKRPPLFTGIVPVAKAERGGSQGGCAFPAAEKKWRGMFRSGSRPVAT